MSAADHAQCPVSSDQDPARLQHLLTLPDQPRQILSVSLCIEHPRGELCLGAVRNGRRVEVKASHFSPTVHPDGQLAGFAVTVELLSERAGAQQRRFAPAAQAMAGILPGEIALQPVPISIPQAFESWRHFGTLLRRCRESHLLTRVELSVGLNVADSTLRNIETGRHQPSRLTLARLQADPRFKPLFAAALPPRASKRS